jgi:anti-sigma factor RsiW
VPPDFRFPFRRDCRECEDVRSLLTDYLDDELEPQTRRRVDRHVRFCPRCLHVLGNLRALVDRLAHLAPPAGDEADDEVAKRLSRSWRDRDGKPPPAA